MGKRGPRPKPDDQRKSQVVSVRIRAEIRDEIERAAAENGRSLSLEINRRLESSVAADRKKAEQWFGGRRNELIFRVASKAMGSIGVFFGGHRNKDWLDDPAMFEACTATIAAVFAKLSPGPVTDRHQLQQIRTLSNLLASSIWNEIKDADPEGERIADKLKRDLGPLVERAAARTGGKRLTLGDVLSVPRQKRRER